MQFPVLLLYKSLYLSFNMTTSNIIHLYPCKLYSIYSDNQPILSRWCQYCDTTDSITLHSHLYLFLFSSTLTSSILTFVNIIKYLNGMTAYNSCYGKVCHFHVIIPFRYENGAILITSSSPCRCYWPFYHPTIVIFMGHHCLVVHFILFSFYSACVRRKWVISCRDGMWLPFHSHRLSFYVHKLPVW